MYTFLLFYLFIIVKATIAGICLQKQKPDQIRLAIAGINSVNVGWHSYACPFIDDNPNPTPKVKYGLSPAALTSNSVNGKPSTYNTKNFFTRTSWFYGVELQDLQPRTLYYYQIVAMNNGLASDIFSFTSPPALGDRSQPVKIAAYGDMGVDGLLGTLINGVCLFERAVIALQKMLPSIDFFLHHGDIGYADTTPLLVLGKTYDQAMDEYQMGMMNITSGKKTADYINPDGPIYITNGAIGNPEGNDHVFKRSSDSCRIITDPGFGVLTLVNARQATFSFYRTSDLVELDRINIIKAR
ncbi:unnamed protein product [Rotaria sordida]|uniref:Purple acid phosphatase N-terminal domain-containing protein n=1 Tax=Rotaria sordida TaxID=392033 RepID=A0A818XKA0_9BILA|nr:unnamed protein product [Rotaria sordida]